MFCDKCGIRYVELNGREFCVMCGLFSRENNEESTTEEPARSRCCVCGEFSQMKKLGECLYCKEHLEQILEQKEAEEWEEYGVLMDDMIE